MLNNKKLDIEIISVYIINIFESIEVKSNGSSDENSHTKYNYQYNDYVKRNRKSTIILYSNYILEI